MKKTVLRMFALLLALLMLVPVAVACKKNEEEGPVGDSGEVSTAETHPVPLKDLGGKDYVFATSRWSNYDRLNFTDIYLEAYTGDFVEDAAYTRVLYMQENFNCNVKQEILEQSQVVTKLEQNAYAGEDAFDFVLFRGYDFTASVNGGYLADISRFNINIENSWWDKNAIDTVTINNKSYALVGDVSTNHLLAAYMTVFNKTLIANNELDDPYKLVEEGTWTFEKMSTMAKSIADDMKDGIEGMSKEDIWGIHYTRDNVLGLLSSCGVKVAQKDANGVPTLVIQNYTSDVEDILKKLYDETYACDTISSKICKAENADTEFFDKGRVLFCLTATHNASVLRASDVEYGILPYPKLSAEADYVPNTAGLYFSYLGIPINNADFEDSAIFLEAFAAQGQLNVRPQFYENVLLRKVGKDMESANMLQYIFENINYDIGCMFDVIGDDIRQTSIDQDTAIASMLKSKRGTWLQALKEVVRSYSDEETAS